MRVSKFVKVNKNILLEYLYDDSNNIGYPYKILINNQNNQNNLSYLAGTTDLTSNTLTNQLFRIDLVNNTYGKIDTTNYSFLQLKDYSEGFPARHDTLKIHLPVNYTFEEYIGFYIRVFTLDYNNKKTYDLSNFYFDITDVNQSDLLDLANPSLLFQEKLWTKFVKIDIPSVDYLSGLRTSTSAKENTINYNLTGGFGLSVTSPIFIDFHFIKSKKTINNIVTYTLTSKYATSLPQTPDFEKLGLKIEHSKNGDFFEIFGVYNGNVNEFNDYIMDSINYGNKYIVEYIVTLFEQNIRGKSFKIVIEDNFNEKVEYRPIIKFSTTTAIIDVEMNVIDLVDGASIQRRASYGMLQDEVAKYSLNLTKINLSRSSKPKIYNIKSPEGAGIFGNLNGSAYSDGRLYGNAGGSLFSTGNAKNLFGLGRGVRGGAGGAGNMSGSITGAGDIGVTNQGGLAQIGDASMTRVIMDPFPVYYSVFSDKFNVVAKTESVQKGKTYFFGIGKMKIVLKPFDQFVKFIVAKNISDSQTTFTPPEYLDFTNMGEIKLIIKNTKNIVEFKLYTQSQELDISKGILIFRVTENKINEIRTIYNSGINVFYITTTTQGITTDVYSGLFTLFDDKANVNKLNNQQEQVEPTLNEFKTGVIIDDPNNPTTGTAVVTRRILRSPVQAVSAVGGRTGDNPNQGTQGSGQPNLTNSTVPGKLVWSTNNIELTSNSEFIFNGYRWTPTQLKNLYSSPEYLLDLKFEQGGTFEGREIVTLTSKGKLVDSMSELTKKLEVKYLTTSELKTAYKNTTGRMVSEGNLTGTNTSTSSNNPPNTETNQKVENYTVVDEKGARYTVTSTVAQGYKVNDLVKLQGINYLINSINNTSKEIKVTVDKPKQNNSDGGGPSGGRRGAPR